MANENKSVRRATGADKLRKRIREGSKAANLIEAERFKHIMLEFGPDRPVWHNALDISFSEWEKSPGSKPRLTLAQRFLLDQLKKEGAWPSFMRAWRADAQGAKRLNWELDKIAEQLKTSKDGGFDAFAASVQALLQFASRCGHSNPRPSLSAERRAAIELGLELINDQQYGPKTPFLGVRALENLDKIVDVDDEPPQLDDRPEQQAKSAEASSAEENYQAPRVRHTKITRHARFQALVAACVQVQIDPNNDRGLDLITFKCSNLTFKPRRGVASTAYKKIHKWAIFSSEAKALGEQWEITTPRNLFETITCGSDALSYESSIFREALHCFLSDSAREAGIDVYCQTYVAARLKTAPQIAHLLRQPKGRERIRPNRRSRRKL